MIAATGIVFATLLYSARDLLSLVALPISRFDIGRSDSHLSVIVKINVLKELLNERYEPE